MFSPLDLPKWQDLLKTNGDQPEKAASNGHQKSPSKFPFDKSLNEKIILWQGPITQLNVDAIVNSTNETFSAKTGVSAAIFNAAGSELLEEISRFEGCKTGEVKITKGWKLSARYILHTVGPRFNPKYKTAAENALHTCYRNCLQSLKELTLTSIAFCTINSVKRGYPRDLGCHIALRTVRRTLEKFCPHVQYVVFCVEPDSKEDFETYRSLLPLYFPRSLQEENVARGLLPADTGNESGETVIAERKIRISAFPGQCDDDDDEEDDNQLDDEVNEEQEGTSERPNNKKGEEQGSEVERKEKEKVGKKVLSNVVYENPDEKRVGKNGASRERTEEVDEEIENEYDELLAKAKKDDLSDIAKLQLIYNGGVDSQNRPVIVIVGRHLPVGKVDLDRVMVYIVSVMQEYTRKDHQVVYFHSNMFGEARPHFSWLKKVYNLWEYKYGYTLHRFYICHATFMMKVFFGLVSPFLSPALKPKKVFVNQLSELYSQLGTTSIKVPNSVLQFDKAEFGSNYALSGKGDDGL